MDQNASKVASNLLSRVTRKRKQTPPVELVDEPIEIQSIEGRQVVEVRQGEIRIVWVAWQLLRVIWVSSRVCSRNKADSGAATKVVPAPPGRKWPLIAFAAAGGLLIAVIAAGIYSPGALKDAAAVLTALSKLLTTAATLGLARR